MDDILQALKSARKEKQLKQVELGSKLGLPQSHISKIEQGLTDPRLSTVRDMARMLDLELILVPRSLLPALDVVLHGKDPHEPMWLPDDEEDDT